MCSNEELKGLNERDDSELISVVADFSDAGASIAPLPYTLMLKMIRFHRYKIRGHTGIPAFPPVLKKKTPGSGNIDKPDTKRSIQTG